MHLRNCGLLQIGAKLHSPVCQRSHHHNSGLDPARKTRSLSPRPLYSTETLLACSPDFTPRRMPLTGVSESHHRPSTSFLLRAVGERRSSSLGRLSVSLGATLLRGDPDRPIHIGLSCGPSGFLGVRIHHKRRPGSHLIRFLTCPMATAG